MPFVMKEAAEQQPERMEKHALDFDVQEVQVVPVEIPGTWLPKPPDKPLEMPKEAKKNITRRGSDRRKHWSYVEQARVTLAILLPWF